MVGDTLGAMRVLGSVVGRVVAALIAGVGAIVVAPLVASAHTDVDFTLPTDGAAVGEPVAEITVGFNDAVTLIGPGFEVLDPQGNIVTPFVVTDDDMVFRLQLDPPIGGGEAAVRYEVRAEDGHTISGGFSFTISVDAPTTTAVPATTVPATTNPPTTNPATTPAAATTSTAVTASTTAPADVDAGSTPDSVVDTDDGSSSTGVYVLVAVAVVVAAGAFLLVRSRSMRAG